MATDLLVIVDDNSGAFSYSWSGGSTLSSPWVLSTLTQWYRSTSWYTASTTQTGTFTFTFNGTSAAFIGNTPRPPSPQTATVQIDNGIPFGIDYEDPAPPTYKQWFITPTLSDGRHTITISNLSGTAIDYAAVKVGSQTLLTGQTVIVDDDSSLIQYSGQWSRNTNKFIPGSLPTGYPYGNATHRSSNPGDTFTFRFSGTSIAVHGIFSWYNLGALTATYSIDGTPYPSSIFVTTSSPSYLNSDGETSNYLYFGQDNLPSGTHTLLVNITEARNQTFILDYITYKPSFDTLSSMPSLSSGSSGVSPKSSGASSTATSSSGSQKSVSTGTIVGAVIGGLALGVLVTILVILILRRRRDRERDAYQDATLGSYPNDSYAPTSDTPSQMQDRMSPLRPQSANGLGSITPFSLSDSQLRQYGADVKHARHERNESNTGSGSSVPPRSSTAVQPLVTPGVDEPLVLPPAYDAISNRGT